VDVQKELELMKEEVFQRAEEERSLLKILQNRRRKITFKNFTK